MIWVLLAFCVFIVITGIIIANDRPYELAKVISKKKEGQSNKPEWIFLVVSGLKSKRIKVSESVYEKYKEGDTITVRFPVD